MAVISGLSASRPAPEEKVETTSQGAVPPTPEEDGSGSSAVPFKLWPICTVEDIAQEGSSEGLAAAVAVAAPAKPLELLLSVQPSSMPASLTVMYQGEVSTTGGSSYSVQHGPVHPLYHLLPTNSGRFTVNAMNAVK